MVRPIHGPNPFALRAAGPACGCPNVFQTNLSNPGWVLTPSLRAARAPLANNCQLLSGHRKVQVFCIAIRELNGCTEAKFIRGICCLS